MAQLGGTPLEFVETSDWPLTALSYNAEAYTNNRPFQTVELEKLTKKFYKKNSCALLGAGAYI